MDSLKRGEQKASILITQTLHYTKANSYIFQNTQAIQMFSSRRALKIYFSKAKKVFTFVMFCWLNTSLTLPLFSQAVHPGDALYHNPELQHEANFFFQGAFDSKYVSEGRDNLDEGGLVSIAAEWTTPSGNNELVVGAWYAEGNTANYSELNLAAAIIVPLDPISITFVYTWLDYSNDNTSDNELGIELGTSILETIDLTAVFAYSAKAGGTFIELIASKSNLKRHHAHTLSRCFYLAR
jgi:hypothetical protein